MNENQPSSKVVTVLGGGSFGTALANIVATNGHKTFLWFRDEQRANKTQNSRENAQYLPGYPLNDNLTVTASLPRCLEYADVVVIAVPSSSYRDVVRAAQPYIPIESVLVSATKGIEAPDFTLMSDILRQELGQKKIGVLSGPNFAKEVIQNQYTGSVIASDDAEVLDLVPKLFSSNTFRLYANHDRYGVELAGALKNIYAIITGMAAALGCGPNTQAMILTRSLAEMSRFAAKLGADTMTFLGLAGVGDLFLTCSSDLSRNYRAGYAVGKGKSLEEALAEIGQVTEGINTLKVVKHKAEALGVYMPLVSGLHAVLYEGQSIPTIVQTLMTGEITTDVEVRQ